jgi:hypothetical protein
VALDVVFVALVSLATLALLATFGYAVLLGVLTRRTRTGRIIFGVVASIKLFVLLILADFYIAILLPGTVRDNRQVIRFALVVYLLVQSISSLIALERLRRLGEA